MDLHRTVTTFGLSIEGSGSVALPVESSIGASLRAVGCMGPSSMGRLRGEHCQGWCCQVRPPQVHPASYWEGLNEHV